MAKTDSLTAARLREVLHYEPLTGIFTWRVYRNSNARTGDIAGRKNRKGYIQIGVDGQKCYAHRLAWLYMTGKWPPSGIDHRYGIKHDNRWSELRLATKTQNGQNQRKAQKGNKCGLLGVSAYRGGWQARITVCGKQQYLGKFATPKIAHAAYLAAKASLHEFQTIVVKN